MVFEKRKKIIFVHGCFWHRHPKCPNARLPKTRSEFWVPKLNKNKQRDRIVEKKLYHLGYDVLVIWECELKNVGELSKRIKTYLENPK